MKKVLRLAAGTTVALSLMTGVAAANSGAIGNIGHDSAARIKTHKSDTHRVKNNSNVNVKNNNPQHAHTGDATATHNDSAGDAATGFAVNDSFTRTSVGVDNTASAHTAPATGSDRSYIHHVGPNAYADIKAVDKSQTEVTNNTNVNVQTNTTQEAMSGNARVSNNGTGGHAVSGDATNISTNETTVEISN